MLAIKHCRLAMKYDPNMYKAYHLMGNILQDIDKPEEAVKYFTLAERIANAGSIEANNSASEPNPTTLSPSTAYQNLWIWGARINHTYVFKRNNDIWESQIILPDEQPQSHTCISESFDVLEMKCLSERPLIFEVPQLLSYGECDHILTRAGPLLKSSHVMGEGAHSYTKDSSGSEPYRRSMNAWLSRDDVLAQMQSRVAVLTGIPKSYVQIMSEDLQVIKYDMEGQFKLHQDSSQFHPRLLTALVYLQDSDGQFAGGETWFPFAPGSRDQDENNSNLETIDQAIDSIQDILEEEQQFPSQIPRKGLTFSPSKGKAILFFNHLPDGRVDTLALHSGRKLLEGTKWAANYWIKLDPARLDQIANS